VSRIAGALRRASLGVAMAGVTGLLLLAVATTVDVLLRWLLARPIVGLVDAVTVVGAVCLAACMPWVAASRGHIAIDLVGKAAGRRAHRALDAFGTAVTFGFFAVLGWRYVHFVVDLYEGGDVTPVLRWPTWPWWAAVGACIALTAAAAGATLLERRAAR
jgi:TRAP-type C4-dicarboxylate transport system permease small subunit